MEIQITSLRIGNWLMYKGKPYQVVGLMDGMVMIKFKCGSREWDLREEFAPILLTPNWCLQLGFDEEPLGFSIDISQFPGRYRRLCISGDYLFMREGKLPDNRAKDDLTTLWNMDLMKQFYVHELQNVFHSITRQELIYTP